MPKRIPIFICIDPKAFLNEDSPNRSFLKTFKDLFGIKERASIYLEKDLNLSLDPEMESLLTQHKIYLWEDYRIEEDLMEEIFYWLTSLPNEEDGMSWKDSMASREDYNNAKFYDRILGFFDLSTDPRMDIVDFKPITLPINFKTYLRKKGKFALLARSFYLDQNLLPGKLDFSFPLDFHNAKILILELVKENYENMIPFHETIKTVKTILNTVICNLTTTGRYIVKITCNEDPISHSIKDKLDKKKNLNALLPYADWNRQQLVSALGSILIYQYIGPTWKEFEQEWLKVKEHKEQASSVHFVEQGAKGSQSKKRKRVESLFIDPMVPVEEEKAKDLYKVLTEYPGDHSVFTSKNNPIWKKKVWTRFPIEVEFPRMIGCYDSMEFVVESPYEDKETYYDDDRILSSFSGFRWDHQTLEEEYLKDLEKKEEPREDGTVPWKGHEMIEEWLKEHFCCGNEENYNFLKKWITFVNCYPNRKVSVALALRGGNGLTKSFFSHLMSLNFGSHAFSAVDANLLFGHFTTSRLATSCFVTLEEAKLTDVHKEGFKNSVTSSGLTTTNEKYGNISEKSFNASYLICTNNHHYYQCDMDDRRIFGLDFDNKFFKNLARDVLGEEGKWKEAVDIFTKQIIENNYRMWRLYLGYIFNTVRPTIEDQSTLMAQRPTTMSLERQKLLSLGEVEHWWIACIKNKQYIDSDFLDQDGVTKEGQAMKPKLINYRPEYSEDYWDDGRWLKVVHYKDFYLSYKNHMEKRGGKKCRVISETHFISSFARNLPQELQENFNKLSSESPFIVFGPWRDHYQALTLMGWPISTSL